MPTFIHSKLSKFKLDTAGGVLTDISDHVDEISFPEELEETETTTFGATARAYMAGFANASFTVGGFWSRTLHGQLKALKEGFRDGTLASATFEYAPEGTDSGDIKLTGEAVMLNYEKTSAIEDPVRWSCEFRVTGVVTDTTY